MPSSWSVDGWELRACSNCPISLVSSHHSIITQQPSAQNLLQAMHSEAAILKVSDGRGSIAALQHCNIGDAQDGVGLRGIWI